MVALSVAPIHTAVATVVTLAYTVTAVAALIRIVRGPTILDRMVASDVLLTTLLLAVGTDMVLRGHTENIALMTVIAAVATFASIVVSRYVKRRAEHPDRYPRQEAEDV